MLICEVVKDSHVALLSPSCYLQVDSHYSEISFSHVTRLENLQCGRIGKFSIIFSAIETFLSCSIIYHKSEVAQRLCHSS